MRGRVTRNMNFINSGLIMNIWSKYLAKYLGGLPLAQAMEFVQTKFFIMWYNWTGRAALLCGYNTTEHLQGRAALLCSYNTTEHLQGRAVLLCGYNIMILGSFNSNPNYWHQLASTANISTKSSSGHINVMISVAPLGCDTPVQTVKAHTENKQTCELASWRRYRDV